MGRILKKLEERGVLREPVLSNHISAERSQRQRTYAIRKPKDYVAKKPGNIVEVDTLDVRPLPGMVLKHFTARDVISKWDVLEAHTGASSWESLAPGIKRTVFLALSTGASGGADLVKRHCPL